MTNSRRFLSILPFLSVAIAACSSDPPRGSSGDAATPALDSGGDTSAPAVDAGSETHPTPDAGTDAAVVRDSGIDSTAAVDSGSDASTQGDAGTDATIADDAGSDGAAADANDASAADANDGATGGTLTLSTTTGAIGTLLTITGADFSTTQSIAVGSGSALPISMSSSTLVALVMPGATSGTVTVTTGTATLTGTSAFTVTPTGYPSHQQGPMLVGYDGGTNGRQAYYVAISADGNTAIWGGDGDNGHVGAAWVYTRSGAAWSPQGKLIASDSVGTSQIGTVALSADGNTAVIGGPGDSANLGATWVFARADGGWSQQGSKLVGSDYTAPNTCGVDGGACGIYQGYSVAVDGPGATLLTGGYGDNGKVGAAWVFAKVADAGWVQQGAKLVGTGYLAPDSGAANIDEGEAVALSSDGKTAVVGGLGDHAYAGATWVFARGADGGFTQVGGKLVGTGTSGSQVANQGWPVAVNADGTFVFTAGLNDNSGNGSVWVFAASDGGFSQQALIQPVSAIYDAGAQFGQGMGVSADGKTLLAGAPNVINGVGATWIFTRGADGGWTQQGDALVLDGGNASSNQGNGVAVSSDGTTAIIGGPFSTTGGAWIVTQ